MKDFSPLCFLQMCQSMTLSLHEFIHVQISIFLQRPLTDLETVPLFNHVGTATQKITEKSLFLSLGLESKQKKKIHGTSEKIYRVKSSRAIIFPFPLETYKVSKAWSFAKHLFHFKKRAEPQERSAGGQIKRIMSNVITNTTFLHLTACNFIDLGR